MRGKYLNFMLTLVLCSFFFAGCQSSQIQTVTAPEVLAEFEFSGDETIILLPVEFQGQTYQFVLDTGATGTVYDDSFRDKLGKRFLWPKTATLAQGRKAKVEMFHTPNANLGPLKLEGSPLVGVLDFDIFAKDGNNETFQGCIGMDFLQKYIVQIDYDNRMVTFFRGRRNMDLFSFLKPKEKEHPEWGQAIPLKTKLFSRSRYINAVMPEDTSTRFFIDSGWGAMDALKSRLYEKIESKLTFGPKQENSSTENKASSSINFKVVESFSVGNFEYENIFFQKNNESMLGYGFLSRHLVTFDFPNNVMYLKEGENFNRQQSIVINFYNIGMKCDISGGSMTVKEVDPNGIAYKKGIMKNDIFTEIERNSRVLSSFNTIEVMEFFENEPKEKHPMNILFKRGEDLIEIKFEKSDFEQNENLNST